MVAAPAHAQDEDEDTGGDELCALHDPRLASPSGITEADGGGWWVLPDGNNQAGGMSILRVGTDCSVRESESLFIDHQPWDPRSLALDTDGFVWAADTGQAEDRPSIAITQVNADDQFNNVMYRLVFPDAAQDTSAFLIEPDVDTPLFFTAGDGESDIFAPAGELDSNVDARMEQVGTASLPEGGSVTGAAVNADGSKVVLRTESSAYEYTVEDGDIVGAITDTKPVVTPLADGGTSQDIAYDADGAFNTLAATDGGDGTFGTITSYTPAEPAPEEPADEGGGDEAAAEEDGGGGIVDFILGLGFDNIVRILAAIAVVGMIVMIAGIMVIRKSRRERAEAEAEDDGTEMGFAREESVFGDEPDDPLPPDPVDLGLDAGQPDPEVGRVAQGGAVYGTPKAEPTGNVYGGGGRAEPAEPTGNVYGAPKESTGGVYGAPKEPPPPPPPPAASAYGGREEPQYGAFESAGHGSIYNNAGESFAVDPPPPPPPAAPPREATGGVYGGGEATGATYGAPREAAGGVHGGAAPQNVESTGTVYGSGGGRRPQEPEDDRWGPPGGRR